MERKYFERVKKGESPKSVLRTKVTWEGVRYAQENWDDHPSMMEQRLKQEDKFSLDSRFSDLSNSEINMIRELESINLDTNDEDRSFELAEKISKRVAGGNTIGDNQQVARTLDLKAGGLLTDVDGYAFPEDSEMYQAGLTLLKARDLIIRVLREVDKSVNLVSGESDPHGNYNSPYS